MPCESRVNADVGRRCDEKRRREKASPPLVATRRDDNHMPPLPSAAAAGGGGEGCVQAQRLRTACPCMYAAAAHARNPPPQPCPSLSERKGIRRSGRPIISRPRMYKRPLRRQGVARGKDGTVHAGITGCRDMPPPPEKPRAAASQPATWRLPPRRPQMGHVTKRQARTYM